MAFKSGYSEKLKKLPPYLFAEIDKIKRKLLQDGKDIIDLGVGDPDIPTPTHIIERLYKAAQDPKNHSYALDAGMPEFRKAIALWYKKRFNIDLDPQDEILPLIGSKEGIAHLPLAFVDPGDVVLIPEPGYPVYFSSTVFAGGDPYFMPLLEKNSFLPGYHDIDAQELKKAKLMFLNYPNNPTSATCDISFFENTVEFAKKNNIIVCHDAAYTEIFFDGKKQPSFLQADGAKDVGIEFHSLSKTFCMTGWRIGFAVGNPDIIKGLGKIKSNIDSGIFQAIQLAGAEALERGESDTRRFNKIYQERRDIFVEGLNNLGWKAEKPDATFYIWLKVPPGYTSSELTMVLLKECNIVCTPGNGFGEDGEGYVRFALTRDKGRIMEALERIRKLHEKRS
ncbi:LL-diaminopimelate aminotransferase [bacterium]|nr:LL-diaminopimelate aminotransferase [bacterium]